MKLCTKTGVTLLLQNPVYRVHKKARVYKQLSLYYNFVYPGYLIQTCEGNNVYLQYKHIKLVQSHVIRTKNF